SSDHHSRRRAYHGRRHQGAGSRHRRVQIRPPLCRLDGAAWMGLTPKPHSSGGKERLGSISKMGNATLRTLLVVGATSVLRHVRKGAGGPEWLIGLLARRPAKV